MATSMTRNKLLGMLRNLENGGADSDGRQCCSWCGESPPNAPCHIDDAEDVEHLPDCELAKAIAWLEDEENGQEFHIVKIDLRGFGTSLYKGWVLK
jgi:hypothetical protein